MISDRVGIGWRAELAAGILSHLDRIDVVEVIADDLVRAPARRLRAVRTLGTQVPLVVHGISLGLASAAPVSPRRLDELARVVTALEPELWSEHLAFVRGGGLEIGHLAAPPRTEATIEGAARNIQRVVAAGLLAALHVRVGRTGRAAKEGDAYTFMAPDEIGMVRTIERVIGQPIPRVSVPGYDFGTVAAD